MAMRIVPAAAHSNSTKSTLSAPSAPGLPDTLRRNLSPSLKADTAELTTSQTSSTHPLESRLVAWRKQQESLKMEMLRRHYGIAEPVKRQMELQIVSAGEWRPAALGAGQGSANVHSEILQGRDCEIAWEDIYTGEMNESLALDFHSEIETRQKMNW
ncbi:hypothetical protein AMS68_004366 [Peltaster fructicola]|uniref:Proteasome maturation factor UMP1 n=1 Tax=Peltaster fructicola TaxID=286661 RepID=A0A6H0XW59_9PEZI|nr:hypothetical protein AMS68_004366 [Peltaster fructicola]